MKRFSYSVLLLAAMAAACHTDAGRQQGTAKDNAVNDSSENATIQKTTDSAFLLVPGKKAGRLFLGQDMKAAAAILGRPDDGDAAMGSALGIWYNHQAKDTLKKEPVIIFSSYRDSNMVVKEVTQISVARPGYSTAEGLHTGSALARIRAVYPELKKAETYLRPGSQDSLVVYDLSSKGIAFDIQRGICTAITIHEPDRAVNAVYLSVHPELKKVQ